ncbi:MAG: glycosyltransferase [Opitutae bacterium]
MIKSDFLGHSFDPIILNKIKIPQKRKNRIAFFGNLDLSTADFKNRTKFLEQISIKTGKVDVYGQTSKIPSSSRLKYHALSARVVISDKLSKVFKSTKLDYWSDRKNLPTNPQVISAKFASSVRSPRYGKAMFELLASYETALNYHNIHTGNNACNMRLFEATGLGCALLTDAKDDISEYFKVGEEILTYDSFTDLVEKVKYLQNNPSEVKKLGENAQRRTLECHNTDIQISKFIKILKNNFSE